MILPLFIVPMSQRPNTKRRMVTIAEIEEAALENLYKFVSVVLTKSMCDIILLPALSAKKQQTLSQSPADTL